MSFFTTLAEWVMLPNQRMTLWHRHRELSWSAEVFPNVHPLWHHQQVTTKAVWLQIYCTSSTCVGRWMREWETTESQFLLEYRCCVARSVFLDLRIRDRSSCSSSVRVGQPLSNLSHHRCWRMPQYCDCDASATQVKTWREELRGCGNCFFATPSSPNAADKDECFYGDPLSEENGCQMTLELFTQRYSAYCWRCVSQVTWSRHCVFL